ncbi:FtsW/RodA/SpoVE family cell cycle protein [Thermomicrobium sp. 4228-Ro]|uniref:FtsW/RodA/SpoVE family cell cycle protein n=1 Tax=Thermomicrobium sp. 4228-Ro TaxID=2993937 RepID=UPI002249158F|nr:FtsW/RodA/SpoVE family cell cycle protein [Thermomicrobium sp. 4228-Ro]MCX2726082.1 FtsW/RodA/SpoVE family cell cycle protein [Thermomicrobium sp. 4228-Ro]
MSRLLRPRWLELQLLVVPAAASLVGLLTIYLARNGRTSWSWADLTVSLLFIGVVFLTHFWLTLLRVRSDELLLPIVVMLSCLGLLLSQRLGPAIPHGGVWASLSQRQLVYLLVAFLALGTTVGLVRRFEVLRRLRYTWAVTAIALTIFTMLFGTDLGSGARLWIDLGPVTVQPGEVVKVLLVLFLAGYLDDHRELIASSYRVGPFRLPPLPYLIPLVVMWGLSVLVVVLQNDLGNALLLFGIFLVMLYVVSGRSLYVIAGSLAFAVAVAIALRLFPRVEQRVSIWLNPWSDPTGIGLQPVQADLAFAHGHLLGAGWGFGYPQAIPVVATDYAFAAIGEELGSLGSVAVIALYLLLVMRGLFIAVRIRNSYVRLLSVGLVTVLGLQALIILAGNVRLLPLTGITLPFISAGGSSLITNFVIIGLLLRASEFARD